jgi:cell division protein FtsI (penicillin-binding protein 3)
VGAVKMGLRLGPDRLFKYIHAFGFGQQTGIELPGETRGLVKPLKNWSGSSIGAMSIGQEIGVTPLQIVTMVSTIANDGIYTPPRIVAGMTSPTQGFQQVVFRPRDQRRVISSLTAAQMRRMMQDVVLFGTARRALLNGYTAAGKTGTAQKVDPNTHRYSATDYVGSFVGFAPVNTPAISIAVILDSARGLHQGGQVSAPVFKRVAEQVLAYLNVPHDAEIKHDPRQVLLARQADVNDGVTNRVGGLAGPELAEAAVARAHEEKPQITTGQEKLLKAGLALPPATVATETSQPLAAPATNEPDHPPGSVVVQVEGGPVVPDFAGKSMRGAIELAQQSGVALNAMGSGIAREQSPPAGTHVAPHATVVVRFAR